MTLLAILALLAAAACALAAGMARFGAWLDRQSDPDRVTRWNRERVHAAEKPEAPVCVTWNRSK